MLDYNVPGGKLNRGMAVADILRVFKKGEVGPCSTGMLCNRLSVHHTHCSGCCARCS